MTLAHVPISGDKALREAEKLLNQNFPVPNGGTYFDDFPVWNEVHEAQIYRVGARDPEAKNKLVSTASVRIARLKVPGDANGLPVALLGAVATDPDYRRKGLATAAVEEALDLALQHKVGMAFLWGSEHEFYRRLGFELCGTQIRVPLARLNLPLIPGQYQVHHGWIPEIFNAMKERDGGLVLEARDMKWQRAHKNVDWWCLLENGKVLAYAGWGRGMDLPLIIHEWGGETKLILDLLAILETKFPELQLMGPPSLFKWHGLEVAGDSVEYLGMAKIFDPIQVITAYLPHINSDRIKIPKDLEPAEIVKTFYGPQIPSPLKIEGLDPAWLPFPLWFWGLDGA